LKRVGLKIFLQNFPVVWSDEGLKEQYSKAIPELNLVKNKEVENEIGSKLWKWSVQLRGNLLRGTEGVSPFIRAVSKFSLIGGHTSVGVDSGEHDETIIHILRTYFKSALQGPLPDDFETLIKDKIEQWRIPFFKAFEVKDKYDTTGLRDLWKKAANQEEPKSKRKRIEIQRDEPDNNNSSNKKTRFLIPGLEDFS